MADALVSALAQTVLGNINSVVLQEIGLAFGLKDELDNLKSTFETIQLVLQDAELKQRNNKALQSWLMKLKHAAYDADNILDQINTEGLRRRLNSKRGICFRSSPNPLLFHSKMAHKVKDLREKLDVIANDRLKFHLNEGVGVNRFGVTLESRQTSSLVNELEIYGRNDEKEMIIGELLDSKHEQDNLSIYAIWGMGGLGKTTLAQLVYNDVRAEKHFDLRIWVCVSDDFSIQRLVRAILETIQGCGSNVSELDHLQRLLQGKLKGHKFLLVLDDVWNENHILWDGLKEVLRCGSKGSMIIVTTRIEKVAIMMSTITSHNIGDLSEDDSWSLFKQRAFIGREEDENLVAIGKLIVDKCGGVPLAIKALGSLMRFKSDESEWLGVKESEIWNLLDDENGILPALRLSYDNLLPEMRQCFAYCCIFPKDYEMEENDLIRLWMANGFIPSDGQTDSYLTGHLIFKELVWRSFFQDVQKNDRDNTTCKMHDLMHDLAQSIMRHETCIIEHNEVPKFPQMLRHLGYNPSFPRGVINNENKIKLPIDDSLCSFIVHGGKNRYTNEVFPLILSKQQYVRVLNMNYFRVPQKLPSLKYLRYLVLSCYSLKKLPESVTCLLNLQTLKLIKSTRLLELPKSLNLMKNLWFLEIENFDSLICTPPRLRDLTNLHSLSIFIVGQHPSQQIDQLKELSLGGKLSIQGLENVRDFEDAKSANLMRKRNLTYLSLSWKDGIKDYSAQRFEEVLEGLQPHENLIKIFIKSYDGSRLPNWMSTLAFKNLNEISLEYCGRCENLPPLGKLPSLTSLRLIGMKSTKHLGTEWQGDGERSFPALTTLTIIEMPNLEYWTISDSVESFSCLSNLNITGCPKLIGLPLLPTLGSLDISDSSGALVPSIRFLTSLTSLELSDIANLEVLPEGLLQIMTSLESLKIIRLSIRSLSNVLNNLSALKTLEISGCSNLEFFPHGRRNLNSLKTLDVSDCDSLRSFHAAILESMPSLTSLTLTGCKKLDPLSGPLRRTTILQELLISYCPELKHLPESMQQLSALAKLCIHSCEGLYSLPNWFGSLQSLSRVEINYCKNLKYLPDGFQSLKSLRELCIYRCPHLEKRCKKLKGADWPKISHIRIIRINRKIIQGLDE